MPTQPTFWAPEVVQTSTMDCGPAALKCLLEGFGIPVSYGRLREACQTDVDGTSIDTLQDVALQLGLDADQTILPFDHLLLREAAALPALVVTAQPNGLLHFIVVWSCIGQFVQVMDPAVGRRWLPKQRFFTELYRHALPFPADQWRMWAGSDAFTAPLRHRLADLRVKEATVANLIEKAQADPSWRTFATLDAATRLTSGVVQGGGLTRGAEAEALVTRLCQEALSAELNMHQIIPAAFWSVQPLLPSAGKVAVEHLLLRGAVLVRIVGRQVLAPAPEAAYASSNGASAAPPGLPAGPLAPDLMAALTEKPDQPARHLWQALQADGLLTPAFLSGAVCLAALGVTIEAVLLRGLLGLSELIQREQQQLVLGAVLAFTLIMLVLEFSVTHTVLRLGRQLETRLRITLLEKIPRLGDRYFHSRLTADMAYRAYDLRQLRTLPDLGARFLRICSQLLFTLCGILWLDPASLLPTLVVLVAVSAVAWLSQPLLAAQDIRVRTHSSALSRFYLDALLGLTPVRTHRAERAIRREHESLLVEWVRATLAFGDSDKLLQTTQLLLGVLFTIWIVFSFLLRGGEASSLLLLLYWALNIPVLGQTLANLAKQYPIQRNRVLRLLEPLGSPDEELSLQSGAGAKRTVTASLAASAAASSGVAIRLENILVRAGGHTILQGVTLSIQPGEHVAIIGVSGAGKSSLVGLLLGWHRPAEGELLVDGQPLTGERLHELRRATAWVDPGVQLWNRSLVENLQYGSAGGNVTNVSDVIEQAELLAVLENLPNGLQTPLGEGGGLVSGGEGQRVRLGRALLRAGTRLAILDEPFRGLERGQRRTLLTRARRHWSAATLLCITHDVHETQSFDRVLVIEEGRVVEDAPPSQLLAQPASRYRALLAAEEAVQRGLWEAANWRRLWLEQGHLQERSA
ncbi:MAG: ATP-binding cassette domain-containing protein [Caldilineaceae bacterium]